MGFYIYFFLTFIISKIYSYEVVFHLMCQIQCQNISIEYRNPLDAENIRTYNYLFPGYDDLNFSKITLFPKILTNNKKMFMEDEKNLEYVVMLLLMNILLQLKILFIGSFIILIRL